MNFILWLIVGAFVGWLAGLIMHRSEGLILDIVIGIVGALLGGWLISPLVGVSTINQGNFSVASIGVSLLGAIILLAIVGLVRRGRAR